MNSIQTEIVKPQVSIKPGDSFRYLGDKRTLTITIISYDTAKKIVMYMFNHSLNTDRTEVATKFTSVAENMFIDFVNDGWEKIG